VYFRIYIQALEKLHLDIVTRNDLLGVENVGSRSAGVFSRPREPLKNHGAIFALADRASVLRVLNLIIILNCSSTFIEFVKLVFIHPDMSNPISLLKRVITINIYWRHHVEDISVNKNFKT